jgi:RNA polymerase sigma factor (sigma-70 family)
MGDEFVSEHARSFPLSLRNLLEATEGSAEEQAWTAFLDSYSRLILYVARQKASDQDVVMDRYAFVTGRLREQRHRRLRTFAADGRGKFTTWLIVVVRRLCLDHDRLKHGRTPPPGTRHAPSSRRLIEVLVDPEVINQIPDAGPSPDEELEGKQILLRLDAAVAKLDPSDQLLLALRYQDDRSAREIASLMSLPSQFHVYRRLNRIQAVLRQALAASPAARDPPAVQYQRTSDGPTDIIKNAPVSRSTDGISGSRPPN